MIPQSYYRPTETQRAELAAYRDRLRRMRAQRVAHASMPALDQRTIDAVRNLLQRAEREAMARRFES